mgnify:CR=1 FL=1
MLMKIGFIGAGKVGTSMGKYLTERGIEINGYYSKTVRSAEEAADFTNTRVYTTISSLAEDSDGVFVTVPDGAIGDVWEQLKMLPIKNKIISHFSGSLSSEIFSDIRSLRFMTNTILTKSFHRHLLQLKDMKNTGKNLRICLKVSETGHV